MRLAWCTDLHLDLLEDDEAVEDLAVKLTDGNPSHVLIAGDISKANRVVEDLGRIEKVVQRPINFVLGNHDRYGGSFADVFENIAVFTQKSLRCIYLSNSEYVALDSRTALVGHDGWYDGHGWESSGVVLNDWGRIEELKWRSQQNQKTMVAFCQSLSRHATNHVSHQIRKACESGCERIVVLTHVPPFLEVLRREPKYYPWYSSKFMGDMLFRAAELHSNVEFTVLCGHSHNAASAQIAPNMTCTVGGAEYFHPKPQPTIEL